MADSIRISQLDLIDEITIDDRIVINNENVNTNAIKFSNFINSIETYPLLTFEGTVIFNGAVQLPEALNIQMSLGGLTDVNISNTTPDQILKWTGTNWTNADNQALQVTGISVSTNPVPSAGGSLVYNDNGNFLFTPADVPADYTLPMAGTQTLGGVKVGDRLTINAEGVLSADPQTPNLADNQNPGTVIVGAGLNMSTQGVLSVDEQHLRDSNVVTQIASPTVLGQVKVGDNLKISNQGVLDVDIQMITDGAGYATKEWVGNNYVSDTDLNSILGNYTDTANLNALLNAKADIASPTFTGVVQAPTPGDSTILTQVATVGYVVNGLSGIRGNVSYATETAAKVTGNLTEGDVYYNQELDKTLIIGRFQIPNSKTDADASDLEVYYSQDSTMVKAKGYATEAAASANDNAIDNLIAALVAIGNNGGITDTAGLKAALSGLVRDNS